VEETLSKFLCFVSIGAAAAALVAWSIEPLVAGIIVIMILMNAEKKGWIKP
jgi:hypothetical protein